MKKFLLLGVILAWGAAARAELDGEVAAFQGSLRVDALTGQVVPEGDPRAVFDVYNNVSPPSAANIAVSSTDLTSVWGDHLFTTGTGKLNETAFTVFNSGSSAGSLLTATVQVDYFRMSDSTHMGGFTTAPIVFGAGLNPGFFSIVTITGVLPLNINLDTTNLLMTQTVTAATGAANRLGIASLSPINVGTSPSYMYADSATIGGGVAGFYNFNPAGTQTNPGYRIALPEPASFALLAIGSLAALRRRR